MNSMFLEGPASPYPPTGGRSVFRISSQGWRKWCLDKRPPDPSPPS